jgi:DNA-binding CsgD family transcriptional regulator
MFPQKSRIIPKLDPKTYPLGEKSEHPDYPYALALVALSHSPGEHRLYSAMLSTPVENSNGGTFTARQLMTLTGIRSLSTIRRGLDGLLTKLSIERSARADGNGKREPASVYRVYKPDEIIARRHEKGELGLGIYGKGTDRRKRNRSFDRAIARLAENVTLSRREAQVALCCVEGLTNAEIGKRLGVSEQTVKFHLRHIFVKFGVKRRAELISRLLM